MPDLVCYSGESDVDVEDHPFGRRDVAGRDDGERALAELDAHREPEVLRQIWNLAAEKNLASNLYRYFYPQGSHNFSSED